MNKVLLSKPNSVAWEFSFPNYSALAAAANKYSRFFAALNVLTKEECLNALFLTFEELEKIYVQKKQDEAKSGDRVKAAEIARAFFYSLATKEGYKLNYKHPTKLIALSGLQYNTSDGTTPRRNDVITMDKDFLFSVDEDKLKEILSVHVTGEDAEKVKKIHSICKALNDLLRQDVLRSAFQALITIIPGKGFVPREVVTLDEFHFYTK